MARLILGATGSVASVRVPELYRSLRSDGHDVRVVATTPSLHFFNPAEIVAAPDGPLAVYQDADEWSIEPYRRGDPVLHIDFRSWADLFVIAPLDANTLAKLSQGLWDNFLTCVFRAWDFRKPVLLAPAMNTLMWDHPITRRHLDSLLTDFGNGRAPADWALSDAERIFRDHGGPIRLVSPVEKTLACGDVGVGGIAEVAEIVDRIRELLGRETRLLENGPSA